MKTYLPFVSLFMIALAFIACEKEARLLSDDKTTATVENLSIAIYSFACIREGESLLVYDPVSNDFDAFTKDVFSVEWKEGETLIGAGVQIECVCGRTFTVQVTDLESGEIAWLKYTAMDCLDQ